MDQTPDSRIQSKNLSPFPKGFFYLGLGFLLLLIPTLRCISAENDMDIFYLAADELRKGGNPYDGPHMYGLWFYYSPLFAGFVVPFTLLPLAVFKACWYLTGLALLLRIFRLLNIVSDTKASSKATAFWAALLICAYSSVFENLLYGQLTILMVWCCLEYWHHRENGQKWGAAAVLGLGINIKILPVFLLWELLLYKNFSQFLKVVCMALLYMILPYAILQTGFHTLLIQDWLGLLNPLNKEHVNTVGEGGFTDFASMITKYFSGIQIRGEDDHTLAILSTRAIFWIQWTFRLFIAALSAFVVMKFHSDRFNGRLLSFANIAFLMACIPVAFPHQRSYSALLCLPLLSLILHTYFVRGFKPHLTAFVFMVLALLMMGSLIFFKILPWQWQYTLLECRVSGMGMLLLIPAYLFWFGSYKSINEKLQIENATTSAI